MLEPLHSKSNAESGPTDFARATHNPGALLNVNNSALAMYKKQKQRFKKLDKIDQLTEQVEQLTKLVEKLLENKCQ